jgi:5-methylthioadenosine/S-adenosylhomocysteine deaminase
LTGNRKSIVWPWLSTGTLQRAFAQSRRYAGDENAPVPVTVQNILKGATIYGTRCALLDDHIGSLIPGNQADLT